MKKASITSFPYMSKIKVPKNNLNTQRLSLEVFSEKYLTNRYVSWLNDAEITKYSRHRTQCHTLDSCQKYVKSFIGTSNILWAIILQKDGLHIGNINTYIDDGNKTADIGIIMGEKKLWGKGYSKEALKAVCQHLFASGMRKVTAGTMATNTEMIRLMKSAGMIPDGIRVKHFFWEGKEIDCVHMALFNSNK